MTYTVTRAELPARQVAVVRRRVAHDGIGAFLGEAFGAVLATVSEQGVTPAGPPFARYRPSEEGGWDVEAGFPVTTPVTPSGEVVPSTLPAGQAARVVHRGPYDEVAGAYTAAEKWVVENGLRVDGTPWESYLDEPGTPEPRTEVFVPCTVAHR